MKKKKREGISSSWMDTYGDMVTLLLTFFILLFSMSTVEQEKWQDFIDSLGKRPADSDVIVVDPSATDINNKASGYPDSSKGDSDLPTTIEDLLPYFKEKLEGPSGGQVQVERDSNGYIHITFSNSTLFRANQYAIIDEAKPVLDTVGKALKNVENKLTLVEAAGYVADTKNPNSPVNDWYLSSNRASAVINYLSDNFNLKYELLVAIGHGVNNPVGDNNTAEGQRKNRRVVMTIVGTDEAALIQGAGGNYDSSKYPASGNGLTSGTPTANSSAASSDTASSAASSAAETTSGAAPSQG